MQATQQPPPPLTATGARSPHAETQAENERMRHIPPLDWIVQKLDGDIRRRVEILWLPYSDLAASDPRHPAIEAEFRALCRALERLDEIARRGRGNLHPPNDLGTRVGWTLSHVVGTLTALDSHLFGRRYPFHTAERSNAEPLWAATLRVIERIHSLTTLIRDIEPAVDERIYENLVHLAEPMRRDPMA